MCTLARLLGKPPALIPITVNHLLAALAEGHPVAHGISTRRLANIRNDPGRPAAGIGGPWLKRKRAMTPLTPSWQALFAAYPSSELRWRPSRLMRWCSTAGVEPQAVDEAVLGRFIENRAVTSLHTEPQKCATKRSWSRLRRGRDDVAAGAAVVSCPAALLDQIFYD